MIKTVQEGLEKYKEKLRAYKAWTDPMVVRYDKIFGKGNWSPMANWGGADYAKILKYNAELNAMIEVLDLKKEEETAIEKECGIKTTEEPAAAA